ncbi:nitroreductase family protein [Tannockella kyphosi]|uniref:nitroreductase family protein n=1 Tax=Tannockella kyphosi TaxID=2899121 RepID=UPI00201355BE|nr:nitroreductase family protein [Tannockella kyphosi]
MELKDVIVQRRTVRKYCGKEVLKEDLEALVEAANLAPSWKNSQTGRYYIIHSKEMIDKYRNDCFGEYNAGNTKGVGALIVTTFVEKRAGFERDGTPSNELGNGWGCYDLGLQNQNLLLKAHDLGLSTLVMGIRDEPKTRSLLDIPSQELIVSVIAVGYALETPDKPNRKAVSDIVKFY